MQEHLIVTILCSVLLAPTMALAGGNPKAREKAAKKACAAGDFRQGVEILADLYADTNNVTFIFNQARCFQQNRQWENAIDRFREYLRKKPTASERAEAEKHIEECEALRAEEESRKAAAQALVPLPQPVAVPAPTPAPTAAPEPMPPANPVAELPDAPERERGSGLRVTGIVLGSVGVAAVAAGVALNLKANSLARDPERNQDPDTRSRQSSYKTGSIICYGAGAGALVAGVVLYIIGHRGGEAPPPQVSLFPSLTPTGMSLSVQGAFK